MTDVDPATEMQRSLAAQYEAQRRAWEDPAFGEPRQTERPQAMYADLAQRCPVRDLGDNFYSISDMAGVQHVTRHEDVVQAARYLGSTRPAIPLGLDGEEHRKYRRLLDPVFAPRQVAPLAAKIRERASELIEGFHDDGGVEAIQAWCEPLPSSIFLSIMGLPMDQLDDFLAYKNLTLGTNAPELRELTAEERMARRGEAVAWIHGYFNEELDRREQQAPRDDMIGWLLTTEVEGHRLDRDEVLDILGLLMIAGLDTVTSSLGCMLSWFARNPDQRQRVVDDPALMQHAVEELMRFESPVSEGFRKTTADITTPSGTDIPAGSILHVSWSAANMDTAVFGAPLEVDLDRTPNPHIGFASGYHRCLGSHLARLELVTALTVWHERIPDYRIVDGAELMYSGNPRGPYQLPLTWT